ncbi:PilC/PilY family type IV pilus protein [Acinetobacter faecalis]|uniref:PilC/PilY family type IV pilus protein n=1 Tax=Acinetobacter faecalis TaxID=2665161 RepID=UPI002A90D99D|nr:PilC/PilY family type IV pilus protein [Acinetobacter faecalis]MDY6535727.1 PilC/PilY family type IV pilus protein [Acinetobacter faecalis]
MKKVNDLAQIKKYFPDESTVKKVNVTALSAIITAGICLASYPTYASDIEIYKVPEESVGSTTLIFMLDISGSMGGGDTGQFGSRLNRLKQGMRDVLLGSGTSEPLDDKVIIGLGVFEGNNGRINTQAKALGDDLGSKITNKKEMYYRITRNGSYFYSTCSARHALTESCKAWSTETTSNPGLSGLNYYDCYFGSSCRVYYTTGKVRNKTHRDDLFEDINTLDDLGNTPTPYAYATAAAYLMGQKISEPNKQWFFKRSSNSYYLICKKWNGSICSEWTTNWYSGFKTNGQGIEQGAADTVDRSSGNYYVGTGLYSGFIPSVADSKNGDSFKGISSIQDQATNPAKKECSGQGIYFLTDGVPVVNGDYTDNTGVTGVAHQLMKTSLADKGADFTCAGGSIGNIATTTNNGRVWACIGKYAEALLDPNKNPTGLQIKTAVVGFGSSFNDTTGSVDVENAKKWGILGGGGWTAGNSSKDIVDSVNTFVKNLNMDIPSMSTGTSVIPEDALNPSIIQGYAYFPQFEPKVNKTDLQQIWLGNLKKYYVVNNGIYANGVASVANLVINNGVLQNQPDIWRNTALQYTDKDPIFSQHGVLGQLGLGQTNGVTNRYLLTDYKFESQTADNHVSSKVLKLNQIKSDYTKESPTKNDTKYSRQLMGLLGYDIKRVDVDDAALVGYDLVGKDSTLRQIGAPLHSEPVLLTQGGKIEVKKNAVTGQMETVTTGRQDYVLFGTTQGLVQVVDANTGKEKFAFVPSEIIKNQSETFMNRGGLLAGGKNALYYGIDGEWTSHSVYVTDKDGALTVGKVERPIYGSSTTSQTVSGHQWAYGGMRMGGRSYYALDLSDIEKPNVKFHIEPNTGKIYSYDPVSEIMDTKTYSDISQMGQSWSKPVLGYVNWKGVRKLVMFVGGGYDAGGTNGDGLYDKGLRSGYAGYEQYNYKQTNGIGSGVYMFDAENGDLLWKASATNAGDTKVKYLTQPDLKYSVVSSIQTVDRNNDGIVDHLYFGDLAGQAFRVDFANDAKPTNSDFSSQVTRILNVNKTIGTEGLSPRFYLPPTFTAHSSAGKPNGANIVMAVFASGDKSSPLLGTVDSPTKKNTDNLEYNGVYAIYEHDIYSNNNGKFPYYTAINPLKSGKTLAVSNATPTVGTLKYMNNATTGASTAEWGGWYYLFKKNMDGSVVGINGAGAGIIKALKPLIAMENNLYVSQFDPADNGTTTSCGAGVKGHTFATRLCLPQGICTDGAEYTYNLGPGDVKLNVGPGRSSGTRELVVPDPTNAGGNGGQICTGSSCGGGFIPAGGPIKFIPNQWYEKYSRTGNGG